MYFLKCVDQLIQRCNHICVILKVRTQIPQSICKTAIIQYIHKIFKWPPKDLHNKKKQDPTLLPHLPLLCHIIFTRFNHWTTLFHYTIQFLFEYFDIMFNFFDFVSMEIWKTWFLTFLVNFDGLFTYRNFGESRKHSSFSIKVSILLMMFFSLFRVFLNEFWFN